MSQSAVSATMATDVSNILKELLIGQTKLAAEQKERTEKLAAEQKERDERTEKLAAEQKERDERTEKLVAELMERNKKLVAEVKEREERTEKLVAAAVLELKTELQSELKVIKIAMTDATTFVSPTGVQYEADADKAIDDLLEKFCGLRVLSSGRRSIASTDASSGGYQWDGRYSVVLLDSWAPVTDACFCVYGGGEFSQPIPPESTRQLSPSKPDKAHFFAVFEYTMYHDWWSDVTVEPVNGRKSERKAMSRRLELRLARCLQRYNNVPMNAITNNILDVVSVVGVMSQVRYEEAVTELLSKEECPFPLLQSMFRAHRFVHFHKAPMLPQGSPIALALAGSSPATVDGAYP